MGRVASKLQVPNAKPQTLIQRAAELKDIEYSSKLSKIPLEINSSEWKQPQLAYGKTPICTAMNRRNRDESTLLSVDEFSKLIKSGTKTDARFMTLYKYYSPI